MKKIIIFLCILFTLSACSKAEEPQTSQAPAATTQRVEPIIVYEEKVVYNYDFKLDEVKDIPKEEDIAEIITAPRLFDYYNKELKPNKNYGELYVFAGSVVDPYYNGMALQEARYGLVDSKGQVVVEPVYAYVDHIKAGEEQFYILQYSMDYKKGQDFLEEARRLSEEYRGMKHSENPAYIRLELNDTVIAATDGTKAVTYSMVDAVYEFDGNIAVVYEIAGTGTLNFCVDMLNSKLEKVGSYTGGALEVGEPSEGLMAVKGDSFGCYIDNTGAVKVQTQSFYNMGPFRNGYARVWNWGDAINAGKSYRMFGFIDKTGKTVIPLEYYDASHFNEYGYSAVSVNEIFFEQETMIGTSENGDAVINKSNEKVFVYDYGPIPEDEKYSPKINVLGCIIVSKGSVIDLKTNDLIKCPGCGEKWNKDQMELIYVGGSRSDKLPYIQHTDCSAGGEKIYTAEGKLVYNRSDYGEYNGYHYAQEGVIIFAKDGGFYGVYDIKSDKFHEFNGLPYMWNERYAGVNGGTGSERYYIIYNMDTSVSTEGYSLYCIMPNGYTGIKDNTAYVYNANDELIFTETINQFDSLI